MELRLHHACTGRWVHNPAKRVRFNPQTAIRQIPSCKEAEADIPVFSPTTQAPQVFAMTTEMNSAFRERPPQTLPNDCDFRATLKTDPKPLNRARLFLRNFFQMVTGNRSVLRA